MTYSILLGHHFGMCKVVCRPLDLINKYFRPLLLVSVTIIPSTSLWRSTDHPSDTIYVEHRELGIHT